VADLTLSVVVSRTNLSLANLEINDGVDYKIAGNEFLGGQLAWEKSQVGSPFVEGKVTTHRVRQNVQEQISVEVYGSGTSDVQANAKALIEAFSQSSYTVTVSVDNQATVYNCEAADFRIEMTTPRYAASQLAVHFNVERKPLLVSGSI
jgi:hypothetical protein